MKKYRITAFMAASLLFAMSSCMEKKAAPTSSESSTETASDVIMTENVHSGAKYENGTYSGEGFSLYADPNIWKWNGDNSEAACDLQLIVDKEINTCGISVYVSDDDHGGKSAQDIVMNADNKDIVFTGAAATSAMTFYYYEWAIDDNTHGRTYFADFNGKYLCAYAESTNFGYVESKLSELLGSIKTN